MWDFMPDMNNVWAYLVIGGLGTIALAATFICGVVIYDVAKAMWSDHDS